MSVREYAVLYLGKGAKPGGGATTGGGNVVVSAGVHPLDGVSHSPAGDSTRLDASDTAHGLLPKLSGDAADVLLGDGTWGAAGGGTPSDTVSDETAWDIAPDAGASADYSRGDHTHGTPAEPTGGGARWELVVTGAAGPVMVTTDDTTDYIYAEVTP